MSPTRASPADRRTRSGRDRTGCRRRRRRREGRLPRVVGAVGHRARRADAHRARGHRRRPRRGRRDPVAGERQDPLRGVGRRARLRDPVEPRAHARRRGRHRQGAAAVPGHPRRDDRRRTSRSAWSPSSCRSTGRSRSSAPRCRTRCWPATPRSSSRRPSAPLATTRVVQRIAEKLPPGVLNVVTGKDANMAALIQNTDVAKVCFTGSVNGGKRIMEMASEDAHARHARAGRQRRGDLPRGRRSSTTRTSTACTPPIFDTTGQICMNAKRLYVHRSRMDELVDGLVGPAREGRASATASTRAPRWGRCTRPRRRRSSQDIIQEAKDAGADVREFGELPGRRARAAATSCGRRSSSTPTRRCGS